MIRARAHRRDVAWLAALMHRLSGLALALFLPLHFLVLGLAIEGEARLDAALAWSALPIVKFAEGLLIFLLAIHLAGGLRILAIEQGMGLWRKPIFAMAGAIFAMLLATIFLLRSA
jgi:fumarate reductase subunit D